MSMLPLYMKDAFGYQTGLAVATAIGFGFGFVLERSGFGRAPILAAQFYFADMRVFKVMFSAIVTAMLGVTFLAGIGVLDLSAMQIPETFLWAQIVGGFILGVGFILSGYCPGTSVVAAASGNIDGAVTVVGAILGSVAFGFFPSSWREFAEAGNMGASRLTDVLHAPQAVLALGVTLMAVGAFMGGEWVERWSAARGQRSAPLSAPETRTMVFLGFALAAFMGLSTMMLPTSKGAPAPRAPQTVTPEALAAMLIKDPSALYLVDLRDAGSYQLSHLPGAQSIEGLDVASLSSTRTLVVYGGEIPASLQRFGGATMTLEGGFEGFKLKILDLPRLAPDATPQQINEYRRQGAYHEYFTGAAAAPPPAAATPRKTVAPPQRKGSGC